MIRITQLKISPDCQSVEETLQKKAAKLLRVESSEILSLTIVKKSIDARKKPDIVTVYTVDVEVAEEQKVIKKCGQKNGQIGIVTKKSYRFPETLPPKVRPVIVGTGPAGLFCGYMLAKAGCRPILLERGREVHKRLADVERFWLEGILDPASNVQFGEGGAGTFSDGKLTTTVKDTDGRMHEALRIFVEAGAPKEILYEAKPHLGTDILTEVVVNLRRKIEEMGGEVRFESQMTGLLSENGRITGVEINGVFLPASVVVLAIGHSARDTFQTLFDAGIPMEAKSFAVGLRMEHPREMIDRLQYGGSRLSLPAASYSVTAKTASGRGVYSFCMCPGGYVVNASSELGRTAVNGMSYSKRDGANSNSAMIVTVSPVDYERYGKTGPLAGVAFQRHLEERAFQTAKGAVPVERYGDFCSAVLADGWRSGAHFPDFAGGAAAEKGNLQSQYPNFAPAIKGRWQFAPVHEILPDFLNEALIEGIDSIGHKMAGFHDGDAFLSGVESRTSSPVRILRDETGQSKIRGLFPCGEGAGYAGGITSAAMDGILIAEKVASAYGNVVR